MLVYISKNVSSFYNLEQDYETVTDQYLALKSLDGCRRLVQVCISVLNPSSSVLRASISIMRCEARARSERSEVRGKCRAARESTSCSVYSEQLEKIGAGEARECKQQLCFTVSFCFCSSKNVCSGYDSEPRHKNPEKSSPSPLGPGSPHYALIFFRGPLVSSSENMTVHQQNYRVSPRSVIESRRRAGNYSTV